jgi:hypothetical protein
MELISRREYARRRGVTLAAVQKALRSGRIALTDDRIDPVSADAQWAANTDPTQSMRAIGTRPPRIAPAEASGADDGRRLLDAKRRREDALAQLAELELAEKRGHLVNVAQIEPMYAQMVGAFKTELLARDDKLRAELQLLYGIEVDLKVLTRYTLDALTQLSRYAPDAPNP